MLLRVETLRLYERWEVYPRPHGTGLYRRATDITPGVSQGIQSIKNAASGQGFGLIAGVLAAHEIECWLERGILAVRWRAARFYSSCSIAHRDVLNRAQRCDTLCAQKPPCAFSLHPLMTWWPSRLLRLPVFRKSISKVSRRQHTYSCVDVKPLTSLREFRITNAQRFSAEKFF